MRAVALTVVFAVGCAQAAQTGGAPPNTEVVELGADEAAFYPQREDLLLQAVSSREHTMALRFSSDRPRFSSVAYMFDREAEVLARGPSIELELRSALGIEKERNGIPLVVFAVDEDGARSRPLEMTFSYYSPELYAENGNTTRGAIVIDYSEVPVRSTKVGDWIVDEASDDDRTFAIATWGDLLSSPQSAAHTTREKVDILARAIMDTLEPQRGTPSDWMATAAPFDQYRRVVEGTDHVWCDNFAEIFVRAATCFGIPARLIELPGRTISSGDGVPVSTADGHTTTEIFDDELNRWVWLDLTMKVIGAERSDGRPLQLAEFQRAMNEDSIVLVEYETEMREEHRTLRSPDELRRNMMRFFNRDQRYQYYRRATE